MAVKPASLAAIIGNSPSLKRLIETIKRIAPAEITVLITGESGTGKELVARAVHGLSERRSKPFIPINCGALTESLLESELFGHEKGAFTGAYTRTAGKFESADSGTLFLDEVGELSANTQVKLLRVLETGEFMRVGGSSLLKTDIRLITATNRDLAAATRKGNFREDLYYRLNIVSLEMPSLRDRRDDIPLLIDHFGKMVARKREIDFHGVGPETMNVMLAYHWPGNVRELRNFIESMIVLNPDRPVELADFEEYVRRQSGSSVGRDGPIPNDMLPVPLEKTREQAEHEILYKTLLAIRADLVSIKDLLRRPDRSRGPLIVPEETILPPADYNEVTPESPGETINIKEMEKELIARALEQNDGNRDRTAKELGIGVRTLYRKIKEYNLT